MRIHTNGATAILTDEEVLRRRDKDSFDAGFQAGIDFGKEVNAELLAALKVLRADHSKTEPHHEDICPICIQADAVIAKAEGV